MSQYRKAWIAGLCLAALAGLDAALTELPLTATQQTVIKIVAIVLGGVATYAVPNAPKPPEGVDSSL